MVAVVFLEPGPGAPASMQVDHIVKSGPWDKKRRGEPSSS